MKKTASIKLLAYAVGAYDNMSEASAYDQQQDTFAGLEQEAALDIQQDTFAGLIDDDMRLSYEVARQGQQGPGLGLLPVAVGVAAKVASLIKSSAAGPNRDAAAAVLPAALSGNLAAIQAFIDRGTYITTASSAAPWQAGLGQIRQLPNWGALNQAVTAAIASGQIPRTWTQLAPEQVPPTVAQYGGAVVNVASKPGIVSDAVQIALATPQGQALAAKIGTVAAANALQAGQRSVGTFVGNNLLWILGGVGAFLFLKRRK